MDIKDTIRTLLQDGLILVFNQDKLDIVKTAQALIKAGVNNMEVTCRIKKPLEKLKRLRAELPDFVAGAASLIDSRQMLALYNRANPDNTLPTVDRCVDAGAISCFAGQLQRRDLQKICRRHTHDPWMRYGHRSDRSVFQRGEPLQDIPG